jgi:hypothetical protein
LLILKKSDFEKKNRRGRAAPVNFVGLAQQWQEGFLAFVFTGNFNLKIFRRAALMVQRSPNAALRNDYKKSSFYWRTPIVQPGCFTMTVGGLEPSLYPLTVAELEMLVRAISLLLTGSGPIALRQVCWSFS